MTFLENVVKFDVLFEFEYVSMMSSNKLEYEDSRTMNIHKKIVKAF